MYLIPTCFCRYPSTWCVVVKEFSCIWKSFCYFTCCFAALDNAFVTVLGLLHLEAIRRRLGGYLEATLKTLGGHLEASEATWGHLLCKLWWQFSKI